MKHTSTTNPRAIKQPLDGFARGNGRISTLAALRGENPPGARKARNHKRTRRAIARASRKRNR